MHHRVRPLRLASYLTAVLVVPGVSVYVLTQATAAMIVLSSTKQDQATTMQTAVSELATATALHERFVSYELLEAVPSEHRSLALLLARGRYEGEDALKRAVNWRSPLETQEEWARARELVIEYLRRNCEYLAARVAAEHEVRTNYPLAIAEAILSPLGDISLGSVVSFGEERSYAAPRTVLLEAHRAASGGWRRATPWSNADVIVPVFGGAALWTVLMVNYPLTFLLLPLTRHKARIRWVHFARIAAYSIALVTMLLIFSVSLISAAVFVPGIGFLPTVAALLTTAGPVPLLLAWWYCAIRFHLRLPNALAVTLIMAVLNGLIVGLVGAGLNFLVHEGYLF